MKTNVKFKYLFRPRVAVSLHERLLLSSLIKLGRPLNKTQLFKIWKIHWRSMCRALSGLLEKGLITEAERYYTVVPPTSQTYHYSKTRKAAYTKYYLPSPLNPLSAQQIAILSYWDSFVNRLSGRTTKHKNRIIRKTLNVDMRTVKTALLKIELLDDDRLWLLKVRVQPPEQARVHLGAFNDDFFERVYRKAFIKFGYSERQIEEIKALLATYKATFDQLVQFESKLVGIDLEHRASGKDKNSAHLMKWKITKAFTVAVF